MNIIGKFAIWTIGFILQDPGINTTMGRTINTNEDTSIVSVYASSGARGTGFFIAVNDTKYLVTAAHVCGQSNILISARGTHRVLASRPDKDICVASTYQGVTTLTIGSDPVKGEAIKMNGFPGQLQYDVQLGVADEVGLSLFEFPKDYYAGRDDNFGCPAYSVAKADSCAMPVTTHTLKILARGGNSGGPVVRVSDGTVVGIIIGTDGTNGYSAPISELVGMFEGRP